MSQNNIIKQTEIMLSILIGEDIYLFFNLGYSKNLCKYDFFNHLELEENVDL